MQPAAFQKARSETQVVGGRTLNPMAEEEKVRVPDWLRDAVADNLARFMGDMTAVQLAKEAGLKYPKTVERLLRKETNPTLSTLCALAGPLDVQVWEFLIPRPKGSQPLLSGQEPRLPETQPKAAQIPEQKKRSAR